MNNECRDYYIVNFVVDSIHLYTIWYSSITDGFLVCNHKIAIFYSVASLLEYATEKNIVIQDEITTIDCDAIEHDYQDFHHNGCKNILDFWNILSDMSNSLGVAFLGNQRRGDIDNIYNKLFYGCNLEALRGNGEYYFPEWTVEEKTLMDIIIQEGLSILKNTLLK